jgi:type I restriction-modification system DNA methylase subunit
MIEIIKNCTIEGNVIKLPKGPQLDRKLYNQVKDRFGLIGGTWKGGKTQGFVFTTDPTDLLQTITEQTGNLKKEYQFFATPDKLADLLVKKSEFKPLDRILEPSAGQGAIVNAICRVYPNALIHCCELMPTNVMILNKNSNVIMVHDDFLQLSEEDKYDRIIANPPFAKNQDIEHVLKMYNHLNPGGRIVSIMSNHWRTSKNKLETSFRSFLEKVGGVVIENVAQGAFKESGTNISSCIVVIDK